MRHLTTFLLTPLLIIALPFFAIITYANDTQDEETGKPKEKIVHVNKVMDLKPTVKIQYGRDYIVAKSVFPLLTSNEDNEANDDNDNMNAAMSIDDFNDQIAMLIKDEVSEFKQVVAENKVTTDLPKSALKNNLQIDFNTTIINKNRDPIISVRFSIHRQLAGKKELYLTHHSFNYDFNTGRVLALSDLFLPEVDYLDMLSAYSREYLSKRLRDKEKIIEGTTPVFSHFNTFNLQPNGLLITFDQAQVASKRLGTQTVLVPYAILRELIAPDSPLGLCLKRKRSCLQQRVLTGGFMSAINTRHGALDPRV